MLESTSSICEKYFSVKNIFRHFNSIKQNNFHKNQAIIRYREAAGIAWVCDVVGTDDRHIKAITDLIDKGAPTGTQFMENFQLATTNLHVQTIELLQLVQKMRGDEVADKQHLSEMYPHN